MDKTEFEQMVANEMQAELNKMDLPFLLTASAYVKDRDLWFRVDAPESHLFELGFVNMKRLYWKFSCVRYIRRRARQLAKKFTPAVTNEFLIKLAMQIQQETENEE